MASSDVSSVVNHLPYANEGFTTTLDSSILSGAATVGLTSVSGLTNGRIGVFIIEPGGAKEQTFTGTIDTGGSQVTGVVWTRGTNVAHTAGVTIVDYVTGTHYNMLSKAMAVSHAQTGHISTTGVAEFTDHIDMADTKAIRDGNNNELIKMSQTASAVNEFTVKNAATANGPELQATGGDTNIDIELITKGSGILKVNGNSFMDGVWLDWNPTWTNLTTGNGADNSKYTIIGKTLIAEAIFDFGTTTSVAGALSITDFPVTINTRYQNDNITVAGVGHILENGVGLYPASAVFLGSSTVATIRYADEVGAGTNSEMTQVTNAQDKPFSDASGAGGSGDGIYLKFMLEIA